MGILLTGARVIDPSQHLDDVFDIFIADGILQELVPVGAHSPTLDDTVISAAGLVAAPGLVDMHVHLRDPGLTHKEDIASGTRAAVRGGFTAVACMPNTRPVTDSPEVLSYILESARETAVCHVYPIAAATLGQQSRLLPDYGQLKMAGAVALSDDGLPILEASLMREALFAAKKAGLPLISHCEDLSLAHAGATREAEEVMAAREILLAAGTRCPVHLAHCSTRATLEMVRLAKARGIPVTCETAPHYFSLTRAALDERGPDARMNPPLREADDVAAVIEALRDGTIDVIATDHAPHTVEEKAGENPPNGILGLETALAVVITYLTPVLGLTDIVRLMSTHPARLLGVPGGCLTVGTPADIVLFDPDETWTVNPEHFASKSRNSPYAGMTLRGKVRYTLVGGNVVHS